MYRTIYVPITFVNETEEAERERKKTVAELTELGWSSHGAVELRDTMNHAIQAVVMLKE